MKTPPLTDIRRAVTALSEPALIRLITEIDDNGPVPPRSSGRIFPDFAPHRIRHATERAHALGLVHARVGGGLGLTESGVLLAEVYDVTARWARRHAYPAPTGDFTGRIRHTFALLAEPRVHAALTNGEPSSLRTNAGTPESEVVEPGLAGPWRLLMQWIPANPRAAGFAAGELAA
ncbi:hypothetical protein [Streptomyces niveus]|uniref:hypothetical protein n=1 Tax=Streptomyces niveus TaxID=193462 RepID=UPI00084CC6A7|nr:hypothetical protein [Streptomyces niveus]